MTNKLFVLISSLVGTVATAATAIVTYIEPTHAVAIVGSVGIASTAIIEILALFKEDK